MKKEALVDLPRFSSPAVQDDFRKIILESSTKEKSSDEDMEIVKILAPLTDNPNAPDEDGKIPILRHTEIVKILAPLTDNANAPDNELMEIFHFFGQHRIGIHKLSKGFDRQS